MFQGGPQGVKVCEFDLLPLSLFGSLCPCILGWMVFPHFSNSPSACEEEFFPQNPPFWPEIGGKMEPSPLTPEAATPDVPSSWDLHPFIFVFRFLSAASGLLLVIGLPFSPESPQKNVLYRASHCSLRSFFLTLCFRPMWRSTRIHHSALHLFPSLRGQ